MALPFAWFRGIASASPIATAVPVRARELADPEAERPWGSPGCGSAAGRTDEGLCADRSAGVPTGRQATSRVPRLRRGVATLALATRVHHDRSVPGESRSARWRFRKARYSEEPAIRFLHVIAWISWASLLSGAAP